MPRQSEADGLDVEKGMIRMSVKTLYKIIAGVVAITLTAAVAWYTLATKTELNTHEAMPMHPSGVASFTELKTKQTGTENRVVHLEQDKEQKDQVIYGLNAKIDFIVEKTIAEREIAKRSATPAQRAAAKRAVEQYRKKRAAAKENGGDPLKGLEGF